MLLLGALLLSVSVVCFLLLLALLLSVVSLSRYAGGVAGVAGVAGVDGVLGVAGLLGVAGAGEEVVQTLSFVLHVGVLVFGDNVSSEAR